MMYYRVVLVFCIIAISHIDPSQAQQERLIQPGDRLQITVVGGPANLNSAQNILVQSDGNISYPFLGTERAAGLGLDDLALLIRVRLIQRLGTSITAVDVAWAEDLANLGQSYKVTVLGQVIQPSTVTINGDAGIQGAIFLAGGLQPGALQSSIKVHRITGDGPSEIIVDMTRFHETGDLRYLPDLQEGDIIIVPGGTASSEVSVLGAVISPGKYQPLPGASVFDMILQAGGFDPDARTDKIRLVKPSLDVAEEYSLDFAEFLQSGQQPSSPPVEAGDVIIVQRRLISYRRVFSGLRDITSIISLISFIFIVFR